LKAYPTSAIEIGIYNFSKIDYINSLTLDVMQTYKLDVPIGLPLLPALEDLNIHEPTTPDLTEIKRYFAGAAHIAASAPGSTCRPVSVQPNIEDSQVNLSGGSK
jgi:hypothetical protein